MKKLDETTKVKLIFSGELMLFAIAFIVLGILELTGVLRVSDTLLSIFKWVTIFGSAFVIGEFIFTLFNKNRREKACWIDKISVIPAPFYIIVLDILFFSNNQIAVSNRENFIAPLLIYLGCVYLFQSIYHWFHPLKELLEDEKKPESENVEEPINNEEQL